MADLCEGELESASSLVSFLKGVGDGGCRWRETEGRERRRARCVEERRVVEVHTLVVVQHIPLVVSTAVMRFADGH